ncbi:MAG: hypothetical protein A2096_14720 [Spirochaetes bacterium GWF1_41_5]|nr:MAG: hypothetical protein A2096_14720 [Spirochaetes bacterium GWF1_41_5]HBE03645.1 hypothetical protein [Spirochaetia bacterium]
MPFKGINRREFSVKIRASFLRLAYPQVCDKRFCVFIIRSFYKRPGIISIIKKRTRIPGCDYG